MLRISLFLLVSFGLLACGSSEPSAKKEQDIKSPNRLAVSELSVPVSGMTAYDLVEQYKSQWLWKSGTHSIQNEPQIQVYVNNAGSHAGSVSSLKRISATNVSVIEYFPPSEAQFRFGMGNSVGAIMVHLKGGS